MRTPRLYSAHRDAVQKTNHLYYLFKDQAELCKLVAEIPFEQAVSFKADISRIIKYAPTELIGRESETEMLNDAWLKVRRAESPRARILTFVGLGGEGKTSLVAKWAADLAYQSWPGCDAAFAWSFYSQGTRDQSAASSDLFLAEALSFFGDAAMAGSAQGAFDKGRRLAQLVGERRALLILDGLEPLQYALKKWKDVASSYGDLSELELLLGEVAGAVQDAEQSVIHSVRSSDAEERIFDLTVLANALHQASRRKEAEARFQEAEQMQAEYQPTYPLLYSVQGFQYCDLLLTEAERAAWQRFVVLSSGGQDRPSILEPCKCMTTNQALAAKCRAVSERAAQTLKWEEGMQGAPLLDFALHHLILSRAALYEALLGHSDIQNSQSEIDAAESGLRHAGQQQYLPLALLTRACLQSLTGDRTGPESAQSDLDGAWEIAERGSMKLYMADIHLYRARLFFRDPSYTWRSPQDDLAAAEKLINDWGYHRRDEELADAKQAILGQSLQ